MTKQGLAAILALYLALAASYAAVTPFGQPPDESAHALYVQAIVQQHRLPVLRREHREAYENHQPPLYYLLASPAWAAAAAISPTAARAAARGVSILIGAAGVWIIAVLGWALFPAGGLAADALALGAAGFAALLPMRLATAASVSNDTLTEAIFTAGLLLMVRLLRHGLSARRAAGLGLVLGLGVLTKNSDLLLFPVALVALLLAAQGNELAPQPTDPEPGSAQSSQPSSLTPHPFPTALLLRSLGITFGVALLIGGGWMARNARLYGDPLGTRAFEQYFQDTPTPAIWKQLLDYNLTDVLWRKDLPLAFESFWGVFGHMQFFMGRCTADTDAPAWAHLLTDHHYPPPSWLYPLLLIPTAVAVAGLGLQAFRRAGVRAFGRSGSARSDRAVGSTPERRNARTPECLILALAWFLVLAAFVRFNTEFFQAQGRYLFPAMGPSALGFTAGWLAWWPARRKMAGTWLLIGGMLALALYALLGTLIPAPFGR